MNTTPPEIDALIQMGWQLAARLERLSVDSFWAHRASGVRRSLIRALEDAQEQPAQPEVLARLETVMPRGYTIVENGAREMGDRK